METTNDSFQQVLQSLEPERLEVQKKAMLYLLLAFLAPAVIYFLNLESLVEGFDMPGWMSYIIAFLIFITLRTHMLSKFRGQIQQKIYPLFLKEMRPEIHADGKQNIKYKLGQSKLIVITRQNSRNSTIKLQDFRYINDESDVEFGRVDNLKRVKGGVGMFLAFNQKFDISTEIIISPDTSIRTTAIEKMVTSEPTFNNVAVESSEFEGKHTILAYDVDRAQNFLSSVRQQLIQDFEQKFSGPPIYYFSQSMVAFLIPMDASFKKINVSKPMTDKENLENATGELKFYLDSLMKSEDLISKLNVA